MKARVGFEFGIADSIDAAPTRHFLLLVLLESQIQYPIEFVVTQIMQFQILASLSKLLLLVTTIF